VVHSMDGLDEISLSATTRVCEVKDGAVACYDISPETLGLAAAHLEQIRAETVEEYADALRSVLAGDTGPRRDAVLANAAAALYVAGLAPSIQDGIEPAANAIDSGAAAGALQSLIQLSHEPA